MPVNPIKWGEPIPAPAPAVEGVVSEKQGTILHLQRLSTEDGPGIRTTVFFKGCPLHCAWCHNPESIPLEQQVQWLENRCIGCLTCLEACPQGALRRVHGTAAGWRTLPGLRRVRRGLPDQGPGAARAGGQCG